jgi:hypothetical protein
MYDVEFEEVLTKEPTLTYNGFDSSINSDKFKDDRLTLEKALDEFIVCCEWINKFQTQFSRKDLKEFNFLRHHLNSYFLTHSIEKWSGVHISNGAFIAALIYKGIKYKPVLGSPDVLAILPLKKETPYL